MRKKYLTPRYIDLFAGCGGFSLGLEMAKFENVFALEKSEEASATYYHNFIDRFEGDDYQQWFDEYVKKTGGLVENQIKEGLVVADIRVAKKYLEKLNRAQKRKLIGKVDLIAGGPPCQGFSLAGRRKAHDERNDLAWSFLDIVELLSPNAVIIENVEGMTRDFIKHAIESPFMAVAYELAQMGFEVQPMLLNAKYYGVPQNRPRAFIVGIKRIIAREMGISGDPSNIFSLEDWLESGQKLKDLSPLVPRPTTININQQVSVEDALRGLKVNGIRRYPNQGQRSSYLMKLNSHNILPSRFRRSIPNGVRYLKNHDLRNHSAKVQARFSLMQIFDFNGINRDLLYWEAVGKQNKVEDYIRHIDKNVIEEVCREVSTRFKDIEGFRIPNVDKSNCLLELIKMLKTKKHSQRILKLEHPSPTIMTIPDDCVHPTEPRVLTVREEARIQSFPDNFEFKGSPTTGGYRRKKSVPQYTQVGNAVPPLLAFALGKNVMDLLKKNNKRRLS